MDNAIQALMIAFSLMVFVIALSISVFLITKVTRTSEYLAYHADSTKFYDNIDLARLVDPTTGEPTETEDEFRARKKELYSQSVRYVSIETVVPTLYRYNKENFCIKIYDADGETLLQIFDLNLEGLVNNAKDNVKTGKDINTMSESEKKDYIRDLALNEVYNNSNDLNNPKKRGYYLFAASWLGKPETIKTRVDLFVNGEAGFINNQRVDYTGNKFATIYKSVKNGAADPNKFQFKEQFISYSYSGDTYTTEDDETLVRNANAKDKIVIIYTLIEN